MSVFYACGALHSILPMLMYCILLLPHPIYISPRVISYQIHYLPLSPALSVCNQQNKKIVCIHLSMVHFRSMCPLSNFLLTRNTSNNNNEHCNIARSMSRAQTICTHKHARTHRDCVPGYGYTYYGDISIGIYPYKLPLFRIYSIAEK